MFRSDNLEKIGSKEHFKLKMVKIPMKKQGTTNGISLFLDLINVKDSHNFYVGVSEP